MTRARQPGTTGARRRPPSPRASLSREEIVAQTLRFADRHGLEGLTMRRLAEALGVGTMTLYGYFRDKDDLLDAVVDASARQLEVPPPEGPWRDRLSTVLHRLRRGLEAHPTALQLRFARPIVSPGAMRIGEAGVRALQDAGFDAREAALAWRALFNFTYGFASFSPAEPSDEARRRTRAALAALPPDEYPTIAAAVDEMVEALGGDEAFQYGLDRLLDGLEARLPAGVRRRP